VADDSSTISREIRKNTEGIQEDTAAIRQDASQILGEQIRLRQEIERLRRLLPEEQSRVPQSGRDYVFNRYFEELTSYADTVCDELDDDLAVAQDRYPA
jgi:regulator of replication initiation timing